MSLFSSAALQHRAAKFAAGGTAAAESTGTERPFVREEIIERGYVVLMRLAEFAFAAVFEGRSEFIERRINAAFRMPFSLGHSSPHGFQFRGRRKTEATGINSGMQLQKAVLQAPRFRRERLPELLKPACPAALKAATFDSNSRRIAPLSGLNSGYTPRLNSAMR